MAIQKDYKAIAGIIKQEWTRFDNVEDSIDAKGAMTTIAFNISEYFYSKNKWFNRGTFINACGIT
ncbi:hypothetical protein LCGC14_0403940 [marine sediment metagenome]|uniref:Uncharacterized protein n=1 Tax=marine sediment metagenome TaxID=412755 RepID=A0A0F9SVX4_9ZZZZ